MFEIEGKFNTAKIFTDTADRATISQVISLLNQPCAEGSRIRIMPDCHAGAGCVIGTTMTVKDKVIPNLVGVDIGCGMLATKLKEQRVDLPKLDSVIRKEVPSGQGIRSLPHSLADTLDVRELACFKKPGCSVSEDVFRRSIGSAGGGNHYFELDRDEDGSLWLVIHTGSRRSGKDVAEYYQQRAYEELNGVGRKYRELLTQKQEAFVKQMKKEGRGKELEKFLPKWRGQQEKPSATVPYEVSWCEGALLDDYLHDMEVMQRYAALNRRVITQVILKGCKLHAADQFETVHNYIDTEHMILRKGAVSARAGEKILIPINMRDGALVCVGKGNDDWNQSAPHGAGRLMSRAEAKESISMTMYKESMKGIYTTSVSRDTVDESPMAYKPIEEIINNIGPTAEVISRLLPVYNFKPGDR